MTLFLKLTATAPSNQSPDLTKPDFLGNFKLPTTGWVRVRSADSQTLYQHREGNGRSDFQVAIERTQNPAGWSVALVGRCA